MFTGTAPEDVYTEVIKSESDDPFYQFVGICFLEFVETGLAE
jgi:hypothetical protein